VRGTLTALAGLLTLTAAACGGGSSHTANPPVPEVVSGSSWADVTVSNGTASADVRADARANLTPLLATRALDRPAPLTEYGLDHPQATLTYKGRDGSTVDVAIGQPNFDRHFVYLQRRGQPAVYLVPADTLRPVLALVGIEIKPPE
jgi:hypothetical protein